MNTMRTLMLVLVLLVGGVIIYTLITPGFSIKEFLGLSKATPEQELTTGTQAKAQGEPAAGVPALDKKNALPSAASGNAHPPSAFPMEDMLQILSLADQNQRKKLLDDQEKFKVFVRNEAAAQSIYAAVKANKFDENERNQVLAKRAADNIMREMFIRQLIASKIPPDFPSDEQVKTYYEKNKDKFVVGDRLPVWQIFLQFPKDASQKDVELVKKQAEAIVIDIESGKVDFSMAANKYSGHKESKYNGGYMGMVKVSDMKPEIQKTLVALEPEKVGGPIATEEGVHILKRGLMVPRKELQLDEVQNQIKQYLLNQARIELRQAIYQQAAAAYPVDIDDKRIEEWRLKMRIKFSEANTGKSIN